MTNGWLFKPFVIALFTCHYLRHFFYIYNSQLSQIKTFNLITFNASNFTFVYGKFTAFL